MRARRWLAAMTTCVALGAAPAAHAATDTWTGQGPGAGDWQQGANWAGGSAPLTRDGLVFPALAGCDGASRACYASTADGGPLTASQLSIADDVPYDIVAAPATSLALAATQGATTLRAAPSGADSGHAQFWVPITLDGAQQWSVEGGSLSLGFVSSAPATSPSLTVDLQGDGQLFLDNRVSSGPLTLRGDGRVDLQSDVADAAGDGPGTVAADGPSIVLGSIPGDPIDVGHLTLHDSALRIGSSASVGPGTTTAKGDLDLSSVPTTTIALQGPAATAGRDYGALSVTGAVTLGGDLSLLDVRSGDDPCPVITRGTVDTFIRSLTGQLSGRFANLPDGAITQLTMGCGSVTEQIPVAIHYSATSVSGTIEPAGTTVTVSTPSGPGGAGDSGAASGSDGSGGSSGSGGSGGAGSGGSAGLPAAARACRSAIVAATPAGRGVRVTVARRTRGGHCALTARLRTTGRGRRAVWIGAQRLTIGPGGRHVWAITLDGLGRRMLAADRRLTAEVMLVWSEHGRTVTIAQRRVVLRAGGVHKG